MTLPSFLSISPLPAEALMPFSFLIHWLPLMPCVHHCNSRAGEHKSLQRVSAEGLAKPHWRKSDLVEVSGQFRFGIWSTDIAGTVQQTIIKRARNRLQGCNSLKLLQHFLRPKRTLHILVLSNSVWLFPSFPVPANFLPPFPPGITWNRH